MKQRNQTALWVIWISISTISFLNNLTLLILMWYKLLRFKDIALRLEKLKKKKKKK